MSSAKHTEVVAAYVKTESTYNTYASPAGSDAIRLVKPRPDLTINYAYDGSRAPQNLGYARIRQAGMLGRTVSGVIRTEGKGRGAAYTSSAVEVPDIHRLIASAGFTAAVTTTGGSEKWTFTPTAATSTPSSSSIALYTRGELFPIAGVYNSLRIVADGPGIPVWEFPFVGTLATAPSDATPSPTFTVPTIMPPSAAPAVMVIGGNTMTWVVRSFTYDHGRSYDNPRVNLIGTDAHAGFSVGQRQPFLETVVEATSLQGSPYYAAGAIDPYNLRKAASGVSLTLTVGSTQYNKYKITFTAAQLRDVELVDEAPTALWRLRWEPYNSEAETSIDDVTLTFD